MVYRGLLLPIALALLGLACTEDSSSSTTGLGVGGTGPGPGGTPGATNQGAGAGGSSSAGAPCSPDCSDPPDCCDGVCVNQQNDVHNCGFCGKSCPNPHPYCNAGVCEQAPCDTETSPCDPGQFCCGGSCCAFEELCCDTGGELTCFAGETCPP